MKDKLKFIFKIIAILLIVVAIVLVSYSAIMAKTQKIENPIVTFEIENYGNIKVELYPEYAPNTVANFIKLAQSGYYNNKVVYGKDSLCLYIGRTSDGGIEEPTLSLVDNSIEEGTDKDKKYQIFGEFVANGFERNSLRHEKGVITMVRSDYTAQMSGLEEESYNSANAQIGVIMNEDGRNLNGLYAGFAKITEGFDIIEKIYAESELEEKTEEETEASSIESFKTKPVIKNVTVETFGADYGVPETLEYFDYQAYMTNLINQYYTTE